MRKEKTMKCIICNREFLSSIDYTKTNKDFVCPICRGKIICSVNRIRNVKVKSPIRKLINKIW